MNAYSTVSGGVMFVPDEIERKKPRTVTYAELAPVPKAEKKGIGALLFDRRKHGDAKKIKEAA